MVYEINNLSLSDHNSDTMCIMSDIIDHYSKVVCTDT